LRKEPGVQVEEVEGNRGELTVLVDGKEVAHQQGDSLPTADEVRNAVRGAAAVGAGG
jgi:hypothetical protein